MNKLIALLITTFSLCTGLSGGGSAEINKSLTANSLDMVFAVDSIFDPMGLVAKGAKLEKLPGKYSFTEGPAVDKEGNIFFSDQPNDKIYKWSAKDGEITEFSSHTGRANGMYFDKDGNLIACADMYGQVVSFDKEGKMTVLAEKFDGKILNGPNDIWINPVTGGMYITDPLFVRDYWDASDLRKGSRMGTSQQGGGFLYYVNPKTKEISKADEESYGRPNGVVGTPDGKTLYVVKMPSQVNKYDINPDGTLSNKRVHMEKGGGDGMTLDEKGNLYICATNGLSAYDKDGKLILNIPTGEGWTSNVVFGGKDGKTLFITALTSVFTIDMQVKGVTK